MKVQIIVSNISEKDSYSRKVEVIVDAKNAPAVPAAKKLSDRIS